MNTLIAKLGATGDVVRTTTLLHQFPGHVTWITEAKNESLLGRNREGLRCLPWEKRYSADDRPYDLVINLEDTPDVALFVTTLRYKQLCGAYINVDNILQYTDDSRPWFDLSLISRYGRTKADQLKFENRESYQTLLFRCLGFNFSAQPYILPSPEPTELAGDVAINHEAGPVWPMKNWAYYPQLKQRLEENGLKVNLLPKRSSLLQHLGDVANHRCVVGGDSLPMHFALGTRTRCVTLFTCTSPWEIHDYGIQTKLISPLLGEFFYQRTYNARATTTIDMDDVFAAVMAQVTAGTVAA
jgi:heptosyltransferase II